MIFPPKAPNPARSRRGMGTFLSETPATDAPKHLFSPLFPRNPLSPPSGPAQRQFQGPPADSKFLATACPPHRPGGNGHRSPRPMDSGHQRSRRGGDPRRPQLPALQSGGTGEHRPRPGLRATRHVPKIFGRLNVVVP
jgi:hypothetical protein